MTINQRLFTLMKEKKITQKRLADELKTTQSTIQGWKERGTIPNIEQLPVICELLDITWEYLVTGEDRTPHYTADERQLVAEYRKCSEVGKERIREYTQAMQTVHPERESETEPRIS